MTNAYAQWESERERRKKMNNHKYICQHRDLDLLLPKDVAREFREAFAGGQAWRIRFDGRTP